MFSFFPIIFILLLSILIPIQESEASDITDVATDVIKNETVEAAKTAGADAVLGKNRHPRISEIRFALGYSKLTSNQFSDNMAQAGIDRNSLVPQLDFQFASNEIFYFLPMPHFRSGGRMNFSHLELSGEQNFNNNNGRLNIVSGDYFVGVVPYEKKNYRWDLNLGLGMSFVQIETNSNSKNSKYYNIMPAIPIRASTSYVLLTDGGFAVSIEAGYQWFTVDSLPGRNNPQTNGFDKIDLSNTFILIGIGGVSFDKD